MTDMKVELIKEIRKKAIIEWASKHGITVQKFMDEPENIELLEIFAELIVKECMDVVLDSDPSEKMSLTEPYGTIIENIKEHFGLHDE